MNNYAIYNERKLDAGTAWLLFLFLGWHYGSTKQIGKQILFYITLGGLGFWSLYLLFTLSRKIKSYNRSVANEVGFSADEMMKLGIL